MKAQNTPEKVKTKEEQQNKKQKPELDKECPEKIQESKEKDNKKQPITPTEKEEEELNLLDYKLGNLNVKENNNFTQSMTWESLGVKENIIKGLLDMKFLQPSRIQATTFPLIIKEPRTNIIAQAKNGSGKTGAFGLGTISSIDENNKNIQAVIFAHTRELVIQVKQVLEKIAKYTKVKVTALLSRDNDNCEYGQIIVITPGHFDNCFLRRGGHLVLENLKMLILDEADYMLTNEVTSKVCEKAFNLFQKNKMDVQILFFSATFGQNCEKLLKKLCNGKETQRMKNWLNWLLIMIFQ